MGEIARLSSNFNSLPSQNDIVQEHLLTFSLNFGEASRKRPFLIAFKYAKSLLLMDLHICASVINFKKFKLMETLRFFTVLNYFAKKTS